jgi:hypothetical protein
MTEEVPTTNINLKNKLNTTTILCSNPAGFLAAPIINEYFSLKTTE